VSKIITQVNMRYSLVMDYLERKHRGISVNQLCNKYSTTRKTISKWVKRFLERGKEGLKDLPRRPKKIRNKTPETVEDEICRIKLENIKLGPRSIWHMVKEKFKLCITTVYNILVRKGIYKLLKPKEEVHFYEANRPNELWHIDIARKRIKDKGKKWIVAIEDDYSRKVLACDVYSSKEASVVCKTVKKAVNSYGMPYAILSDNGRQFIGKKFSRLVEKLGIKHIRTAVRNPKCNGKLERWIRTLKEECLRKQYFKSTAQMQREIDKFVNYYNCERNHQGIGDITPDQRYYQ
jgi:transposase InsO family protein